MGATAKRGASYQKCGDDHNAFGIQYNTSSYNWITATTKLGKPSLVEFPDYSSCSSSCRSSSWGDLFKKGSGSGISNRIGVKFGGVVTQVNTHRFTVSDF